MDARNVLTRQQDIKGAVQDGTARWRHQNGHMASTAPRSVPFYEPAEVDPELLASDEVVFSMPRRAPFTSTTVSQIAPRRLRLTAPFRPGFWLTVMRALLWVRAISRFSVGVALDKVRGVDTPGRRAIRLRKTITRIGGSFIKIGQQASVRADLLPQEYTEELTSLLDRVEPFDVDLAIVAIEQVTGRPLSETFSAFDPTPIGSASIACVYQAVLHTGDRVAVKVRRPDIGRLITADLRILGWVSSIAEALTLVRPGFTDNVLSEVRLALLEELDFFKEARFQEIFRRRSKKARRRYFTAPKVYPDLSGENVIVEEFVSGIWLFELLAAVETGDTEALAKIAELNIDPAEVARRLIWVSHWGLWDSVFFHGDPHPANIIVQRDNLLVFIDFGAMGTMPASRRSAMRQIYNLMEHEDLEGMARLSLTLLEPLPPIDTDQVIKAVEQVFWDALIANRSKQSEWYERTSAQLWLGFFRVTSRFKIPMSFDTVRLIRATLLYDTLAARLDHDIDLTKEYRRYRRDSGKEARERLVAATERRIDKGLDSQDYLRLEQLIELGRSALVQADRLATLQTFNFGAYVGKLVSTIVLMISLAIQLFAVTAAAVIIVMVFGPPQDDGAIGALSTVLHWWPYQLLMAVLVVISIRRILFRLKDREL
jgi:ubiquinone biosynthesis protein